MKIASWTSVISILLLITAIIYIYILKQDKYEEEIIYRNSITASDSLRQIDSTKYAKLTYQYFELDSFSRVLLHKKDEEIIALTRLKAKVMIKIDTVYANYKEKDSTYVFSKENKYYFLSGKVKILDGKLVALVIIDSLEIPVELDVAFVKRKDDMIELQINTNNKYVVINDLNSYIKVPSTKSELKKFDVFGGILFGSNYGVGIGARYKNLYLMSTMTNKGYNIGVSYGFWK